MTPNKAPRTQAIIQWLLKHQKDIDAKETLNIEIHAKGTSPIKVTIKEYYTIK